MAEIEPFQCMRAQGTFNGEAVAIRLLSFIEVGSEKGSGFLTGSSGVPSLELKLGQAGLSVPAIVFQQTWRWLRAREVVKVQSIIGDHSDEMWIQVNFKRMAARFPLKNEPLGLDAALLDVARALLRHLDPIALAGWYWSEGNYPPAIQIYNGQLSSTDGDPEIELKLARVELECRRSDRALKRLLSLKPRVPEKLQMDLARQVASARFNRGEYDKCESAVKEAQAQSPNGEHTAALHSQLALVSMCKPNHDYRDANVHLAAAVEATLHQLRERLHVPREQLANAMQLRDEISGISKRSDLFPLVWNLWWAYFNIAICWSRLPDVDAGERFEQTIAAVHALRLLDEIPARPLHFGAMTYRANAAYLRRKKQPTDAERLLAEQRLADALTWENQAILQYEFERSNRPGDLNVLIWLGWSYFGKFDCLHRMIQAAKNDGFWLERERTEALSKCKDKLEETRRNLDRHYQAEAAFMNACLSSVQSNTNEAIAHLRNAIDMTRSTETGFSDVVNTVIQAVDLDDVRTSPEFAALVQR